MIRIEYNYTSRISVWYFIILDINFLPPPMTYREFVKETWIWNGIDSNKVPMILPSYECELVIHLSVCPSIELTNGVSFQVPRVHWVGPQTRPWKISTNQTLNLLSIRFYPGSLYYLYSMDMKYIQNSFPVLDSEKTEQILSLVSNVSIEESKFSNTQLNRKVIEILDALPINKSEIPAYVQFAVLELMQPKSSIIQISKKIGISKKQLERKFMEVFGILPSEYKKIHKLLLMIRSSKNYKDSTIPTKLADIATEYEYTDQSHFSNQFKRMAGQTPAEWFLNYKKMSLFYNTDVKEI